MQFEGTVRQEWPPQIPLLLLFLLGFVTAPPDLFVIKLYQFIKNLSRDRGIKGFNLIKSPESKMKLMKEMKNQLQKLNQGRPISQEKIKEQLEKLSK